MFIKDALHRNLKLIGLIFVWIFKGSSSFLCSNCRYHKFLIFLHIVKEMLAMAYQHVNTKPEFSCILFAENKGRRESLSAFKKADIFQ